MINEIEELFNMKAEYTPYPPETFMHLKYCTNQLLASRQILPSTRLMFHTFRPNGIRILIKRKKIAIR
jgi:hypothetical protein